MAADRYSDGEIIRLIKSGGDDRSKGIVNLYNRSRERMLLYLTSKVGEVEAEEVFQEAFLNLVVNVEKGRFKGKSTLYTYLTAIANNLCLKLFTKQGKDVSLIEWEDPISEEDTHTKVVNDEMAELVDAVMAKLNDKQREVLLLTMQRYSAKEIAKKLNYKDETVVRITKSRALKKLRDIIKKDLRLKRIFNEIFNQD